MAVGAEGGGGEANLVLVAVVLVVVVVVGVGLVGDKSSIVLSSALRVERAACILSVVVVL